MPVCFESSLSNEPIVSSKNESSPEQKQTPQKEQAKSARHEASLSKYHNPGDFYQADFRIPAMSLQRLLKFRCNSCMSKCHGHVMRWICPCPNATPINARHRVIKPRTRGICLRGVGCAVVRSNWVVSPVGFPFLYSSQAQVFLCDDSDACTTSWSVKFWSDLV